MAELKNGNDMKTIAFYLPQFHAIPENDKAYGKGFVEWTNTKKAKPLYDGHYQPRTPYQENYYDLSNVEVMEQQSELAQKYGVWGFCYYHYWFKNGKKLLEKPVEQMLQNPKVTIPFCLSWANENWSKRWDGGNHEVIMEQDYGDEEDWEQHFQYLLPFFKDPRYITIDGKVLFLIYKPELMPNLVEMKEYLGRRAKESGLKGIVFASQYPTFFLRDKKEYFDYFIGFEPICSRMLTNILKQSKMKQSVRSMLFKFHMDDFVDKLHEKKNANQTAALKIYDYDEAWNNLLKNEIHMDNYLYGAFVDWDNTPRNVNGISYKGATPEKFYKYMSLLKKKVMDSNSLNVIFINAWNEWAEGAYLEPDEKYGFQYLEALKKAIDE